MHMVNAIGEFIHEDILVQTPPVYVPNRTFIMEDSEGRRSTATFRYILNDAVSLTVGDGQVTMGLSEYNGHSFFIPTTVNDVIASHHLHDVRQAMDRVRHLSSIVDENRLEALIRAGLVNSSFTQEQRVKLIESLNVLRDMMTVS